MKRSMIVTATVLALASLLTGCGANPTSGVPYKSTVKKSSTATAAAAPASQVGTVVLQLSALKSAAAVDVKLTGPGLAQPLTRRMTAAELATSNTVAFENVPTGAFQVTLTAFDSKNATLGSKNTNVMVQPAQEAKVALQLKLNPTGVSKFDFDVLDGDAAEAAPEATATPAPAASATPAPSADEDETGDDADAVNALKIEVVSKQTVRKLLVLKKLSVTVKVTNTNATETLSGSVKVDYYNTSGLISKSTKLVETLTQTVKNLAPGKSVELTLVSTKSADDAEATVDTVLASSTSSTAE